MWNRNLFHVLGKAAGEAAEQNEGKNLAGEESILLVSLGAQGAQPSVNAHILACYECILGI